MEKARSVHNACCTGMREKVWEAVRAKELDAGCRKPGEHRMQSAQACEQWSRKQEVREASKAHKAFCAGMKAMEQGRRKARGVHKHSAEAHGQQQVLSSSRKAKICCSWECSGWEM